MPLRCSVVRRAATPAEVDAAIAGLDERPGCYFGCDAGVPGLHPLQATLAVAPALALHVFDDGLEVEAHDGCGAALLAHPALQRFVRLARRGSDAAPFDALRAFLAAFEADTDGDGERGGGPDGAAAADVLLVGALRFEAHRLAGVATPTAPSVDALGTLFFAPSLLRRDAVGAWRRVELRFDDAALQRAASARPDAPNARNASMPSATGAGTAAAPAGPTDDFAPGAYAPVVARAVERLARQPLVSLTLSQSFRRRVGAVSAAAAFAALRRANPAPATFFVGTGRGERVFGASPDLQLRVRPGGDLESFPVCGTVARGHGPVGEAAALRALLDEDVDAASLAVCTDALRNDLAPLCEPGSLRLLDRRRPLSLATVVHTVDRFAGRLRDGVDAWDAIAATAAPVMVTGTPRALALDAIAALEASPRGWYGGLVVQVAADGGALVGTVLRAAVVRDGVAEVRCGGDLLADSDPVREEHESRVKAVSLWRALGLAVDAGLQAAVAGGVPVAAAPVGGLPAAVALHDGGDPFAAAVAETLRSFGVALRPSARCAVRIGLDGSAPSSPATAAPGGLVAIGDAAVRLLGGCGFATVPIRPQQGRLFRSEVQAAAPIAGRTAFTAMRHATLALAPSAAADAAPAGWTVWARDEAGRPAALADPERHIVCLLFRPESLLGDVTGRDLLRAALALAGGAPDAAADDDRTRRLVAPAERR